MSDITSPIPVTAEYSPSFNWFAHGQMFQNRPVFNPLSRVPEMMTDADLLFGLRMIKGPVLAESKFYVDCDKPDVKERIVNDITRFWRTSADEALKAVEWGWSGSEVMLANDDDGSVRFDYLKGLQSPDVKPRQRGGVLSGIRVRGIKTTGEVFLSGMKAFWFVHEKVVHPWWGRSVFFGAFPAFLEYWTPKGFRDMRRLFMAKYCFKGETAYYPPGSTTLPDGTTRTYKDIMREALELAASGYVLFLPDVGGNVEVPRAHVEPPQVTPYPDGLTLYGQDLRYEKWTGMGIPPEVARAEETTGAYAGRQVPMRGFYYALQRITNELITQADQQIFRPIVRLNYGERIKYEIVPLPLYRPEEEEGGQQQPQEQQQGQVPIQMSDSRLQDSQRGELKFNGLCFWHERRENWLSSNDIEFVAMHAPKGGVTIRGTFYRGGEWIPGSVIARASREEKARLKAHDDSGGHVPIVRGKGKKADYSHAEGKRIDKATMERIRSLRLPPAWIGVKVARDPTSPLQAVGYDSKGRQQRVYSAEHTAKMSAEKFARIKAFVKELPQLRKLIAKELKLGGPNTEEAAVLALIDATGFRVGSDRDTGAAKKAYGASTLQSSHVKIEGGKAIVTFIGKKGVAIKQVVTSPMVVKLLADRAKRGGRLFDTIDSKVRDYLHEIDGVFKVKDFRTAVAAETALVAMKTIARPTTEKEFKNARLEVAKIVAAKLGNTPAISLKSYIPPEVFGPWESILIDKTQTSVPNSPRFSKQPTTRVSVTPTNGTRRATRN